MTDSPAQERYRQDAVVLARIGRLLANQVGPITVRVPAELARQAAEAWSREDEEESWPEDPEQSLIRHFASTLAFVGLAVGDELIREGEDVEITLRPQDVAGCMFAAEHAAHLRHPNNQGD